MKTIRPVDSGRFLVEMSECMNINQLIREFNRQAKELFVKTQIELSDTKIELDTSKTRYGTRLWFKCPNCQKRVGKLYKHPLTEIIACRICNNLEYRSRRYKGMIEQNLLK